MDLKEKRQAMREYAREIGMCWNCLTREAAEGKGRCNKCVQAQAKYNRTYRKKIEAAGKCPRCYQLHPGPNKTCPECIKKMNKKITI